MTTKVMIVDDSRVARIVLKRALLEVCIDFDIDIVEADCGEAAWEAVQAEQFDGMIVDYHMPGMNGVDLSKRIKEKHPDTPVLMISANVQDSIRSLADDLGIGYLTKPIKPEQLNTFVKEVRGQ